MPTKKNPLYHLISDTKKPDVKKPAKPDFVALAAAKIDCKARDLIEYRLYPTYIVIIKARDLIEYRLYPTYIVIISPAYTKHRFPLADLDPDFVSEYL